VLLTLHYNMVPTALRPVLGMAAVTTSSDLIPAVLFGVPPRGGGAAKGDRGHAMARKGEAGAPSAAGFASSLRGGIVGPSLAAAGTGSETPCHVGNRSAEFGLQHSSACRWSPRLAGQAPLKGLTFDGMDVMLSLVGTACRAARAALEFGLACIVQMACRWCRSPGYFAFPNGSTWPSTVESINRPRSTSGTGLGQAGQGILAT